MQNKTIANKDVFERDIPISVRRLPHHESSLVSHGHEFDELVLILGGTGEQVTSRTSFRIDAGDVFFISREMTHRFRAAKNLDVVNVLFDARALRFQTRDLHDLPGYHVLFRLEPQLRLEQQFHGRLTLSDAQRVHAGNLADQLRAELEACIPGYRFTACALLMQLISYLSRCYTDEGVPEQQRLLRLGEVLSYIERQYSSSLTVSELAGIASMSESSLNRAFRRLVGSSPMGYVMDVRIDKAAERLRRTDLSITEISYECGFNDSNYLSRQFKRIKGCSPRTYRQTLAVQ